MLSSRIRQKSNAEILNGYEPTTLWLCNLFYPNKTQTRAPHL